MKLSGQVAFVTGSNRGIGRALLEALLARGVRKVYASARQPVAHADSRVVPVALDITDPAQVRAAAAAAGDVNLLVNNAGVMTSLRLFEATPDQIAHDFAVNVHGVADVMRAFAPCLAAHAKQGAAMLNILSVVCLAPISGFGCYSASKAAQWWLVQLARMDLRAKGVAVHAAFPGPVDTDMIKHIDSMKFPPELVANNILDGVEAGTEDIAADPMANEMLGTFWKDPRALAKAFAEVPGS